METMYNPIPFSPSTILSTAINAVETRLFFEDVSVFGPAPNLITLKASDGTGETVLMINVGTNFIDVQRGYEGVAQAWAVGSTAARYFTAKDQAQIQANLHILDQGIAAHEERTDNPHSVTKADVGLSNVDNTADIDKPVSTAINAALSGKANVSVTDALAIEISTTRGIADSAAIKAATASERAEKGIIDAASAQETADEALQGMPTKRTISVPLASWVSSTTYTDFGFQADISIPGLLATDHVDLTFETPSMLAGSDVGGGTSVDTFAGIARIFSAEPPTQDLYGSLVVTRGDS